MNREDFETLFWSKVDVRDFHECWEWTGAVSNGYGAFGVGARKRGFAGRAHRVAYALVLEDPGELNVLHACDNKPCCNPMHLYAGTQQDNMDDKVTRDRQARGEKNNKAKLTAVDIPLIRADRRSQAKIAEDYGVSRPAIGYIKRREHWKHVS